jgi:hypothetical protein
MARVSLPEQIELTCTACREVFFVRLRQLRDRDEISCPFCAARFNLFDALTGTTRRKVYYAIRDELERLVYEKQLEDGRIVF